jgi:hypothetical protein
VDEVERGERSPQPQERPSPREIAESAPGDGMASTSGGGTDASAETGNESVDAGSQVMGRLPRTRPQRRSGRRPAAAVKTDAAKTKPSPPTGAKTKRSPSTGAKTKLSPSTGARQRATAGARGRATASSAARGRSAPSRRPAETATRAAARKRAPGIPQLAVDVAVGAAKVPLKVTASVTRRATHLIGRGLRLR